MKATIISVVGIVLTIAGSLIGEVANDKKQEERIDASVKKYLEQKDKDEES